LRLAMAGTRGSPPTLTAISRCGDGVLFAVLSSVTMLRVELHAHTADDPADLIPHSTSALIDRAAELGYDAVAVTLHDRQLDLAPWRRQALERGIVLIPGIERTIQGRHVLLLNFPPAAEHVDTFDALRALKRRFGGLVIAPHPFYPGHTCIRGEMDRHPDLFDAVEWTWFYTRRTRLFNERAVAWARAHGRPVVANADVHRLRQLGTTYSLVDADRDVESICESIRAGRVTPVTQPIGVVDAASYFSSLLTASLARSWRTHRGALPEPWVMRPREQEPD
jgi:predicted metal-dependent phosphoesterase TrpH